METTGKLISWNNIVPDPVTNWSTVTRVLTPVGQRWRKKASLWQAYADNNGIELIGDGEQADGGGATVNLDVDRIVNGVGDKPDGKTQPDLFHQMVTNVKWHVEGHYLHICRLAYTITITPNNAQKLYFVYNNAGTP